MGRRTKTIIPTNKKLLTPKVIKKVKSDLKELKEKEKKCTDRGKKDATEFESGDRVLYSQGQWLPAKVVADMGRPRSVIIKTPDGSNYKRNSWFLRYDTSIEGNSKVQLSPEKLPLSPKVKKTGVPGVESESPQKNFTVSRFGRTVVPPKRLDL